MSLAQRIENAKRKTPGIKNCIGFALYANGSLPRERYVSPLLAYRYFGQLEEIPQPMRGCIVAFRDPREDTTYNHAAVAVDPETGTLFHRDKVDDLPEPADLSELKEEYKDHPVIFYNPVPLNQRLLH